ncbi:methyltransferase family protein [Litoreibacter ponti]|uniref:Methyltransferase family protein n=1 Tax=Litoreibacter ponti TaxID=1510457 RepID=A0A2T6BL00_9RHOB|nr:methyltransferase domain-containing protein [Litoreibacter ponti]PTX56725.1 methyltransferase family protein [Litoreibacter ponti]
MTRSPSLDAAYALQSPDDNRALYRDWAETYDASFAQSMDYQLPQMVATAFHAEGGTGPVLDIGAGTGLAADALRALGDYEVDALDLSAEMLAVARRKGLYQGYIEADLTKTLPLEPRYNGLISSGTFTHGHVGPDVLDGLLDAALPGALCVLSVNAEHFAARGFAAKFDALAPRITGFEVRTVDIYGASADSNHAHDKGYIAVFRAL